MKKIMAKSLLLCSLSAFICISSSAHTSYPKQIKCPIDGKKFTIYVTASYTTFGTYRDFQKHGAIGDLYESYVNACPECHYSGYQSDFDTTFKKDVKEEILKILEEFKNIKINDVVENEIAIKIHQYFKRDNDDIANLYLVASYYLKFKDDQEEKRKELQTNCLLYLIKAVENQEYKEKEMYASIYYLIGELYRRTGSFDEAISYFTKAIEDENKKEWIKEVAEEQMKLAQEKNDDNKI